MMQMKALILVDLQNDFLPGGALAVPQGDEVIAVANRLAPMFDLVMATQDWHPADHGSFAANHLGKAPGDQIRLGELDQILWPVHCVQETVGAQFAPSLEQDAIHQVFPKGVDPAVDSYSGFFDNGRKQATGLGDFLKEQGVEQVYVMGLATDYCVKFTALDAVDLGFAVYLITDGCRGVNLSPGDVDQAIKQMQAAGVVLVDSESLTQSLTAGVSTTVPDPSPSEDSLSDARRDTYVGALQFAEQQVAALVENHPDYFPIYTEDGKWRHGGELWTDWTGGFLAGMMWCFHRRNQSTDWRDRAEHYSRLLEHRQHDRDVHDLGFIFLSTYLPWYELSGDKQLHDVLIQAGRTLAMRFQTKGQYLRSFVAPESLFIDIMMNVPIIFYAANEASDADLRRIADAHCRTTRETLVRSDGSTAHEGIFDLETGQFLRQTTHQGLRGDSAWARGLAWSLYGYSKCFNLTGDEEHLAVAEENADYWLKHLPEDRVPYWDFDADLSQPPPQGAQKDSSAGAIAASGLLDLAQQTKSPEKASAYRETALSMLDALCSPEYLAQSTPGWEGILMHGVYHTDKNLGVDESVMWGEFFFVEALTKAAQQG